MKNNRTQQIDKLITKALEYKQGGDLINSEAILEKVIKRDPYNFIALNNLGNINSEKNKYDQAKIFFEKAIRIKPNYANAYFNLALINEEMGKKREAIKLYKEAISCDPDNLGFYYNLSRIDWSFFSEQKILEIEKIIKSEKNSNLNKSSGFFILAENQRKKLKLEKEFQYLTKAHKYFHLTNEKVNNQVSFYWIRMLPKIIKRFNFSSEKNVSQKIKPIFIMGLPRSGSTLVESILCSGKKKIPNGGETAIINKVFLEVGKKFFLEKEFLDAEKKLEIKKKLFIQKSINQYKLLNLVDTNGDNNFTDKSLENFFYIELILKFFPDCKIIVCKRNLFEIIISLYQNFLPKIAWSHSIDNILEYIDNYLKIINKFQNKYLDKIYIVELEKLTEDPLNVSKKLFNFCNLEWDQKCLEFYRRNDLISKTASNQQIRSKIFNNKSKKNISYKKFFKPYLNKYEWLKEVL